MTVRDSVSHKEKPDHSIIPRRLKTRLIPIEGIPAVPTSKDGIKWLNDLGLSYSDIAELTGPSLDTIKNIASGRSTGKKILEKLQALIEEAAVNPTKKVIVA